MSKEIALEGYTNLVVQNPDGSVTKFFADNGITSRSAQLRQYSEEQSLRHLPLVPNILETSAGILTMSGIQGERNLDSKIQDMNEALQVSVFRSVGQALRFVHDRFREPITPYYVEQIVQDTRQIAASLVGTLSNLHIDSYSLDRYIRGLVYHRDLQIQGLTATHGDYWLNNILGSIKGDTFKVNGIVDWEMACVATPYVDFAVVGLSMEDVHAVSKTSFWEGYGIKPNLELKKYFSIRRILMWMYEDQQANFDSDFYRSKISLLRSVI